jgi:hypothetical protein
MFSFRFAEQASVNTSRTNRPADVGLFVSAKPIFQRKIFVYSVVGECARSPLLQ